MLPYGVGADSISARAIWGNAKPHGRALLAPTMHFFDSLRLPSRGAQRCVHPLAPSARGLRPQAVGERVVRLSEIFRAMARFSPSAPSGHRSPSGALRHLPRIGGVCLAEGGFSTRGAPLEGSHYISGAPPKAPLEGSSRAAGEGWPGCHDPTPPHPPIKTTKRQIEECLRHSSIFLFIFCAAHGDRIGCNCATNLRKLIVQNAQKRQKMCKTAGIKKKCTTFNTKNVVANLLNSTLRPFTQ